MSWHGRPLHRTPSRSQQRDERGSASSRGKRAQHAVWCSGSCWGGMVMALDLLDHYSIGASRVYIYAEAPWPTSGDAGAIAKRGPSSLRGGARSPDFKLPENLWYHGQLWTLNDCPKRARADGFPWALSVDVDEMLTFVDPSMSIRRYLDGLGSSVGDFDGVLFEANTTPLTRKCGSAEEYACTARRGRSVQTRIRNTSRRPSASSLLDIHHIWARTLRHRLSGGSNPRACPMPRASTGGSARFIRTPSHRLDPPLFEPPPRRTTPMERRGTGMFTGGEVCASCVVRRPQRRVPRQSNRIARIATACTLAMPHIDARLAPAPTPPPSSKRSERHRSRSRTPLLSPQT